MCVCFTYDISALFKLLTMEWKWDLKRVKESWSSPKPTIADNCSIQNVMMYSPKAYFECWLRCFYFILEDLHTPYMLLKKIKQSALLKPAKWLQKKKVERKLFHPKPALESLVTQKIHITPFAYIKVNQEVFHCGWTVSKQFFFTIFTFIMLLFAHMIY